MSKRTKLVDCNSKVFVYDFSSRKEVNMLGLEKGSKGNMTYLERLLLTNFLNKDLLQTVFTLKIPLSEYVQAEDKLHSFISYLQKSSGHKKIKYMAITEIPSSEYENNAVLIHLVTDLEIHELTQAVGEDFSEEEEEEYFENIWGDELYIDGYFSEELLDTFTTAYRKSLVSSKLRGHSKFFHNNLKQPTVYWNEEAEIYIKQHNLLDSPSQTSMEIFDEVAGFVTVNKYSRF